jgi:hypothetical protein
VVLWGVAGLGLLVACVAFASVRRQSRKLAALTQSYWELRYDFTRLRSQVSRLDPESQAQASQDASAAAPGAAAPSVSFVPLSTIRRKDK